MHSACQEFKNYSWSSLEQQQRDYMFKTGGGQNTGPQCMDYLDGLPWNWLGTPKKMIFWI